MTRRTLLGVGSAAAATALTNLATSTPARAQNGQYTLIQFGHVMTLDPALGDLPRGDVLIQGDEIIDVGENLNMPGPGTVLNAEGMAVVPGLVDNHRHLWGTLLRGFSANHTFGDYFAQVLMAVSPQLTTNDVYLGCLLGAYEALDTGVTTILDWNHGTNTRDHAISAVAALQEAGIRGIFGYSSPASDSSRPDAPPTVADLQAIQSMVANDPLVGLAVATRNPESADSAQLQRIADDITQARQMGVPVTLHTGFGTGQSAPQWLSSQGLLGPDTTLVHGNAFTSSDLTLIGNAGAWVSISPETELQMGFGSPLLRAMLDAGLDPTVSADVVAAATGELRVQLRLLLQAQRMLDHAAGHPGPMLPWEDLLPYVTSNAAASLGLGNQIGMLSPGRQADVLMINLDGPIVAPANSVTLAALTAPPSAIDTVLVGGRTVKQGGQLIAGGLGWLRDAVEQARDRLLSGI